MKKALRAAVFLLCIGFSVAAVVNVFADNTEVEQMAKEKACEGVAVKPLPAAAPPGAKPGDCAMSMTRMSRTPFAQSFEYSGKNPTRHISCKRSLILVGAYACTAE